MPCGLSSSRPAATEAGVDRQGNAPRLNTALPSPLRVGIVGAGRRGQRARRRASRRRRRGRGPARPRRAPGGCDAILLCVPDAEIASAAEAVAAAARWWATRAAPRRCPRSRPRACTPSACIRSRPSPPAMCDLRGRRLRRGGLQPEALEFAAALAERLGMTPFEIDDEGRAAYHAAASVASNFLVTLQARRRRSPGAPASSPSRRARCSRRWCARRSRTWPSSAPSAALDRPGRPR